MAKAKKTSEWYINTHYPRNIYEDAESEDKQYRYAAARFIGVPEEILVKLSEDPEDEVREAVAMNPGTPPDILLNFTDDKNIDVAKAAAGNCAVPPNVLKEIYEKGNSAMYIPLASNMSTPPDVLDKIAHYDKDKSEGRTLKLCIANNDHNKKVFKRTLRHIAKYRDPEISKALAGNEKTPPDVLEKIYKDLLDNTQDKTEYFRSTVNRLSINRNTPSEILSNIITDDRFEGAEQGLTNPNTPAETLKQISEDYNRRDVWELIALNPAATADVLLNIYKNSRTMEESERYSLDESIMANKNTPAEVLKENVDSRRSHIRGWAQQNLDIKEKQDVKTFIDPREAIRKAKEASKRTNGRGDMEKQSRITDKM